MSFPAPTRPSFSGPPSAASPQQPAGADPSESLAFVRTHDGIALVDLDETLYLRNSTEDFLDSVRPAVLGLMFLRVLDVLRPWRFTGGEVTRDVWRVQLLLVLFPWTIVVWRRRVRELARAHANQQLVQALGERRGPAMIVTVGFRFIVGPLVEALGMDSRSMVASRLWSHRDRRAGKLAMAVAALGEAVVTGSLVITDSEQDRPLLDRCACPLRVVWPAAAYVPAFSRTYFPGQYITYVKRPGERYILRGILQEDFAFWLLASVGLASRPAQHVAGLVLLLFSFWAVYECGYVDNDIVAARFETDPKLSAAFHRKPVPPPVLQPWLWARGAGALGVFVLGRPGRFAAPKLGAWVAVLVATYLWFRLYNQFNKSTRAWMYLPLQVARSVAFVSVVPVSSIGVLALAAHSFSRWVHYYIYRLGGSGWPKAQSELMRLCFFVVLSGLLALSEGRAVVLTWTALALLAWSTFRARSEILAQLRSAGRIDRREPVSGPPSRGPGVPPER